MATDRHPILQVEDLNVYYGSAHALQGVSLTHGAGVLAVVGRNGMGKTTLCNAITGLVPARGSVRFAGREILGKPAHAITGLGIGYVPQGRRVWPSLSVDEHLRLASRSAGKGEWTVERVYDVFPRLAERRGNGGAQLSGGEQQMLAIGRALLFNPRLLVMDEPTEGLAPVIVEQVAAMLKDLADEGKISVLLIEQNLGVAMDVAETVAVLVNGRVARVLPAAELAADRQLQQRLLGVGKGENDPAAAGVAGAGGGGAAGGAGADVVNVLTVQRAHGGDASPLALPPATAAPNRWELPGSPSGSSSSSSSSSPDSDRHLLAPPAPPPAAKATPADAGRAFANPVAQSVERAAYIVGTFDTKASELFYLRHCIERLGLRTVTVDISTSERPSPAMVHAREVARHHPGGEGAVFTGDRGTAVAGMTLALERFILGRRDVGGIIGAGGSGGTQMASGAMRALPIGVPKVLVSTVASGDVRAYVGPSDICMMYSVADVSGINRISEKVLANAAHALAGMIANQRAPDAQGKPAIGLTMFGVTTPCVQAVTRALSADYDCLVFHATGTGGQSMEKLAESGMLAGIIDVSTTEIADEIGGGIFTAGPGRLDAMAARALPYVGSCGALDMVNFGARDTVPEKYRARKLYRHNDNVTLMRTTAEENGAIGRFIAAKLNRMRGPVRFLLPLRGVSAIDIEGGPFWDPQADRALFAAIEQDFRPGPDRKLIKLDLHVNDPEFSDALVAAFRETTRQAPARERFLQETH